MKEGIRSPGTVRHLMVVLVLTAVSLGALLTYNYLTIRAQTIALRGVIEKQESALALGMVDAALTELPRALAQYPKAGLAERSRAEKLLLQAEEMLAARRWHPAAERVTGGVITDGCNLKSISQAVPDPKRLTLAFAFVLGHQQWSGEERSIDYVPCFEASYQQDQRRFRLSFGGVRYRQAELKSLPPLLLSMADEPTYDDSQIVMVLQFGADLSGYAVTEGDGVLTVEFLFH